MSGIDKCTKLMLHGDGVDNDSLIIDSSYYSKTVSIYGNVCSKTAVKKFGTSAIYFDGVGDYLTIADHTDWYFNQDDFCIDFWINFSTLHTGPDTYKRIITQYYNSSSYWTISYYDVGGTKSLAFKINDITICTYDITFTIGQWYHIALSRHYIEGVRTTRLFIDGFIVDSTTDNYIVPDNSAVLNIGGYAVPTSTFHGYLDEIRISRLVPRFIDPFTPPIEAYSYQTDSYINPLTGDDNNTGASWSESWKTIKYGYVGKPGDFVKIAKSPDPVSIGNATWTNKSQTVTLASPLTQTIELCDANWLSVPNVTLTHDTTYKKQGIAGLKLVTTTNFTTGKMCYKTLFTPLNLSGFTAISFWYWVSTTLINSSYGLKICLCSDTIGDVIVDTFYVQSDDILISSSNWIPKRISKGTPLGSSINSIAIYVEVDPGVYTFCFDNIMACNDFSLCSLITKKDSNNEYETCYPIQSIVSSTILLDPQSISNVTTSGLTIYYGTGGTFETYRREVFYVSHNNDLTVTVSGIKDLPIWFCGGWDPISDELTGQTYFDILHSNPNLSISGSYIRLHNINVLRGYTGLYIDGSYNEIIFNEMIGCFSSCCSNTGTYNSITGKFISCGANSYTSLINSGSCNTFYINKIISGGTAVTLNGVGNRFKFDLIANMFGTSHAGIVIQNSYNKVFGGIIKDNYGYGLEFYNTYGSNYGYDILFQSNLRDVDHSAASYGIQYLDNCTLESTIPIISWVNNYNGECRLSKIGGDINNNIVYKYGGNIQSQTLIRNSISGIAWKMSPTGANIMKGNPLTLSLAKLGVTANTTVTVSCFLMRTDFAIEGMLVCPERQIAGVVNEVSTSINTYPESWQQLTIQFTPTETGVVEIQAQCYGGTTHSVYVDDFSVNFS